MNDVFLVNSYCQLQEKQRKKIVKLLKTYAQLKMKCHVVLCFVLKSQNEPFLSNLYFLKNKNGGLN